jgi:hypothetical protein
VSEPKCTTLDVVVHDKDSCPESTWIQGKYLVHGYDDVLWTDDIETVLAYIRSDLERLG